ncbi:MAG: hypothetical protein M1113_05690 [Candidatus Thermoplasmatota archaeon]|nr:hypothetical protein [Candidatus Thermoplasmatota archaeon]
MDSKIKTLYDTFIYDNEFERKILNILKAGVELDDWILSVRDLDSQIGGFGVHNINRPYHDRGEGISGTYRIPDRGVYRGLQYCAEHMMRFYTNISPRLFINFACSHIEGLVESMVGIVFNSNPLPLGRGLEKLIKSSDVRIVPIKDLLSKAFAINEVLITVKHDFESISDFYMNQDKLDLNSHIYNYQDSIITYFSSRILGAELSNTMFKQLSIPISLEAVPEISMDDFQKIFHALSYNIKKLDPEIYHGKVKINIDSYLIEREKRILT